MARPILTTKLYIPPPPSKWVARPGLIERLNEARHRKLILVSAPAGFGKTTLVSLWVAGDEHLKPRPHVAWLSLDQEDGDPVRFLNYLVAALQTIAPKIGSRTMRALQSPQPPPVELILTDLLNEIAAVPDDFSLILDDYHVLDSRPVDLAMAFLLEHLPPPMHLVVATREDPNFPLARLRASGQLAELRAADLRFTPVEAARFLNEGMGLRLSAEDLSALETRTEGWVVGLQLVALSMQGHPDAAGFIHSFTGSHQYVMDYLVEEVLQQQPEPIQKFLLRTSILERLCGPLCDAVLGDASASSQQTLQHLERANLFLVPLDDERRWYRYHHLFADLLRKRLLQAAGGGDGASEGHRRASQWYEDHGLEMEAFHHAAAANDVARAERLITGDGIPRHFRGAMTAIVNWLSSLPKAVLDARPSLWWRYAALLLVTGQTTGVEEKLQAAEAALAGAAADPAADAEARHLIGRIAAARATLALTRYQVDAMLAQSRRALDYLPSENLSTRANALWTMGYAHFLQGDRAAARRALTESIALSQAARDVFTTILSTIALGNVQEAENELHPAAETYQLALQMAGDQPLQIIHEAHLGLARICYEWNDLEAAERHGRQSLELARQYERVIDRYVMCEVFLARLSLARGDVDGAAAILAAADQSARQRNFAQRLPEIAAAQVLMLLRRGDLAAAAHLAQAHPLPLSQARVLLAQGDPSAALAALEQRPPSDEDRRSADERLRAIVLQGLAHQANGEKGRAVRMLNEALELAEPGGFIRLFLDEGQPMVQLLSEAAEQARRPDYLRQLLAAAGTLPGEEAGPLPRPAQPLIEPLSPRELEVLRLIAQGFSNHEIGGRLFLALDTVKGHNRRIYEKLHVQRRTEAVARARALGLL